MEPMRRWSPPLTRDDTRFSEEVPVGREGVEPAKRIRAENFTAALRAPRRPRAERATNGLPLDSAAAVLITQHYFPIRRLTRFSRRFSRRCCRRVT